VLLERGLRRVIITLGGNGALLAGPGKMEHLPVYPVKPVDTTGAGDAFIGNFAYHLAAGFGECEAIERANVYAALSTLAVGTQSSFATPEQFSAAWSGR
jgi:ribokinase